MIFDALQPRPVISLAGDVIADCPSDDPDAPVVIDGIAIEWGRDSYVDMPRPAHVSIDLLDRTGTWTEPAGRYQVGVILDVTADPGGGGDPWTVFHGRLAAPSYEPGPIDPDTGAPYHWIVHLTGVDITAQLGNIIIPDGTTWPAETALDRAIRLNDAGADTDIAAVYFDPDAVGWQMSPQDVGGKDLLSLLDTFYRSTGSTWAYNPRDNTIRDQWRLVSGAMQTQLWINPGSTATLRAGSTIYEGADGASDPATITYNGFGVEARRATAADPTVDLAPTLDANRVECKWTDLVTDPSGQLQTTSYTTFNAHDWDATRTMRYDSWLADGLQIDPVLQQWSYRIMYEGSFPRHPDLVFDTRIADEGHRGFGASRQARSLLCAGETPAAVYVMGSRYSAVCRHSTTWALATPPPTYSIIGGTIEWRSGWIVTARLQTWYTTNPDAGTVSWSDLSPTGLVWGGGDWFAGDGAPDTFNSSISWGDFQAITTIVQD